MSKAARLKRKRAKARKARSQARKLSRLSRKSKFVAAIRAGWSGVYPAWKIVGGIVFVVAALSEIYFSTWRLSVTPGQALRENDPFSTMFVLHNEGQFAAYNIQFTCIANHVFFADTIRLEHVTAPVPAFNVAELEANSQTSSPCYFSLDVHQRPTKRVDITLQVSYRPSFYPFHRSGTSGISPYRKKAAALLGFQWVSKNKF